MYKIYGDYAYTTETLLEQFEHSAKQCVGVKATLMLVTSVATL